MSLTNNWPKGLDAYSLALQQGSCQTKTHRIDKIQYWEAEPVLMINRLDSFYIWGRFRKIPVLSQIARVKS